MSFNGRPVRLGISSCLLGENVRFDGGHKRDPFLVEAFGKYVEWTPVCPEVEMGLGVPRETLRLVQHGNHPALVSASGINHTSAMKAWAAGRFDDLAPLGLCGYVLKRGSPSCGLERVRLYHANGQATRDGQGMFASELLRRFPELPVEEEGRLNDPRLRENFVSRVFCYQRWRDLCAPGFRRSSLTVFHAQHKYLLMSRNQAGAKRLGALLGEGKAIPLSSLASQYFKMFMEVMRHTPTRRSHTNVLQHLAGHFSDQLESSDRAELADTIDRYRRELLPLIAPLILVRHYVRKLGIEYLAQQIYLDPHPRELMLLNEL